MLAKHPLARVAGAYLAVCAALTIFDLATGGVLHNDVLEAITFTAGMFTGIAIYAPRRG